MIALRSMGILGMARMLAGEIWIFGAVVQRKEGMDARLSLSLRRRAAGMTAVGAPTGDSARIWPRFARHDDLS